MARWGRWLALGLVAAAGALGGAVWDWVNWHPMSAVAATLVAIPLVLAGILLLVVGARRARPVAAVALALGLGIVGGQVLGPTRPALAGAEGSVTVTLDMPTATTATAPAVCSSDTDGQFQISGDPNLRLELVPDPSIPADVDGREFVSVSIQRGDRWSTPGTPRGDGLAMSIGLTFIDDRSEIWLESDQTTDLRLDGSPAAGSVRFSGLVPSDRGDRTMVDLAGTVTWACPAS